jgi:hypothetical protein
LDLKQLLDVAGRLMGSEPFLDGLSARGTSALEKSVAWDHAIPLPGLEVWVVSGATRTPYTGQ